MQPVKQMISPLSKILYLISITSLCFVIRNPYLLSGLFALQLVLWLYLDLPLKTLGRTFKKLRFFIIFVLFHSLFSLQSMPDDVWMNFSVLDRPLTINLTGPMLVS